MTLNKGVCPVCNDTYSNMMIHLVKMKDESHLKYLEKLNVVLDKLILSTDLYIAEIEEEIKNQNFFINKNYIASRIKIIEPNRKKRVLSIRRMGSNNPVFNNGVIDKIRKSVKDKWVQGSYQNRINGMLGVVKQEHPNYKPDIHIQSEEAKRYYRDFLSKFEDISICKRCGSVDNINIHHIDEDHNNILISNMEALCVPCHREFHFTTRKQPFVTISKSMMFAAAHKLPHYIGACEQWHGHEWKIEVYIRKRIDPATMMVMDFKDLKNIMEKYIIDVLDHSTLNDTLEIPTAENILVWCWEQLMFKGHLKGIHAIKLWESHDSSATITKNGMLSVFKNNIDQR
jgi:6-pyruvoyltetrahydropterin/6-carboxytetrahydropterin synthase